MKTRKSIKSTVAIGKGMLVAALALNGFEINAEKTYLEAYRDDVNLVIFLVARCLSNTENKKKESTDISALRASVKKFLRYCGFELEALLNGDISIEDLRTDITGVEAIPCIAYCVEKYDCNGVQREHNKKLNNGLPILHKVPPKRDYGRYFCIMAEKGGTSHGGLTEKLSPFFHAKKQEVNAYGR